MDADEINSMEGPRATPIRRPQGGRFAAALLCGITLGWLGALGCASSKPEPNFKLMEQAWNTIHKEYVDHSALSSKELTYGAISGMVDALGDTGHSTFLTPEMAKELRQMERGEFKGVGVEIQLKANRVVVVAPIDGSPAQKAGIQPGDIILKVGGQDITDWPLTKIVQEISGRAGTKVSLTLEDPRSARTRDVTLVRTSIKLHEVTWRVLPGTSIAHLRLASFDSGVTRDLRKALVEIRGQHVNGIILDLRNNPGGLLSEAIGVASQFLPEGNVLVARDSVGATDPVPVEKGGLATNVPVAVLINAGSASAAEIVAGALRDNHRAPLIGETTFGTGTVLEEFRLSDGSALLLAVEEWLTPAGESFWHKGIAPEYPVALPSETEPLFPITERNLTPSQLQASTDQQLLTALTLVGRSEENLKAEAHGPKAARTQKPEDRAR
jgi:carboxyl-terminal processing protease